MFNFFKGKEKGNVLYAPCKGKVVPLTEVPDPTFSEKLLGDGFAVIPTEGKVYAPADAEVTMVFDTLTVTIPCKVASKEESIAKRDKGTYDKAGLVGARILVVEDNDINAEIATELLEEEGCIIERACNGVECIDMIEKADDSYYAMILMDIQMPVMNGYDATTKIRRMKNQNKAQIPIIAMTANAFTEDKQMAFAVGMNDHVSKPIDMNILVPIMMRYV